MFTGGSQFALVGILASGGAAAGGTAIASAALLGARNAAYGMRMKPVVGANSWWKNAAAAWLTIDESTAVALAQREPAARRRGFWVTGTVVYVGWNLTTLLGALIGDLLGDTRAYGLDAAAAAAFLGLIWPRLRSHQTIAVACAAAVAATALTPVVAPGVPVLAAAVVAVVVGTTNWLGRRTEGRVKP
ncbi:MAG: branched-chain amino acid transporter permease [Mycetocola sp.]|jgi:predicted branched-subunit amino acid permease|nr:branched-chain amino acid transporter permease [Mycetocola sp.]